MNNTFICSNCNACKVLIERDCIEEKVYKLLQSELQERRVIRISNNKIVVTKCFLTRYIINSSYCYCHKEHDLLYYELNNNRQMACYKALCLMNKFNINIYALNSYVMHGCSFFFKKSDSINSNYSFLLKNIFKK